MKTESCDPGSARVPCPRSSLIPIFSFLLHSADATSPNSDPGQLPPSPRATATVRLAAPLSLPPPLHHSPASSVAALPVGPPIPQIKRTATAGRGRQWGSGARARRGGPPPSPPLRKYVSSSPHCPTPPPPHASTPSVQIPTRHLPLFYLPPASHVNSSGPPRLCRNPQRVKVKDWRSAPPRLGSRLRRDGCLWVSQGPLVCTAAPTDVFPPHLQPPLCICDLTVILILSPHVPC